MSIIDEARKDAKRIISSNSDFSELVTFTSTNGETVTVNCRTTKHHLDIDAEGKAARSRTVTATASEEDIAETNSSYPVRNASDEIQMANHEATVTDHRGVSDNFRVTESYPDEYLGLIVLILARAETP